VSTWWMTLVSTCNTGVAKQAGMVGVLLLEEESTLSRLNGSYFRLKGIRDDGHECRRQLLPVFKVLCSESGE
jgi:hypothetical protein